MYFSRRQSKTGRPNFPECDLERGRQSLRLQEPSSRPDQLHPQNVRRFPETHRQRGRLTLATDRSLPCWSRRGRKLFETTHTRFFTVKPDFQPGDVVQGSSAQGASSMPAQGSALGGERLRILSPKGAALTGSGKRDRAAPLGLLSHRNEFPGRWLGLT